MNRLPNILYAVFFLIVAAALPLTAAAQDIQTTQDDLQYMRPVGQDGVTVFEAPVEDDTEFDGMTVKIGGAFTQQLQAIDHSNDPGTLPEIGRGFNLATANLDLDAQLADGIRVHVRTYLSSRHHPEAYVKGGYLQINKLPFGGFEGLMENLSIRAGHFMPNYGDAHFRRTDNADAIQNPFVGNYVLDAFTTEVGAEATYMSNGFILVGGFGGELSPTVLNPDARAPSFHGKIGFDRQLNELVRVRLTGSAYYTKSSAAAHLHSGDRAGSRYYNVVAGGDWSGRIRDGFADQVTAFMVNPFLKVGGLELFGTIETTSGNRVGASGDGTINHYAGEAVYRFLDGDLFAGVRYNTMPVSELDLSAYNEPANWVSGGSVDRWQIGAGWFMTKNILTKAEYVTQTYEGFPDGSARDGAEFSGVMIEAVVSF